MFGGAVPGHRAARFSLYFTLLHSIIFSFFNISIFVSLLFLIHSIFEATRRESGRVRLRPSTGVSVSPRRATSSTTSLSRPASWRSCSIFFYFILFYFTNFFFSSFLLILLLVFSFSNGARESYSRFLVLLARTRQIPKRSLWDILLINSFSSLHFVNSHCLHFTPSFNPRNIYIYIFIFT